MGGITSLAHFDSDGVVIDVGNLDAKNKKMAQEDGLNVKNKGDDRGDFVTIKEKLKLNVVI